MCPILDSHFYFGSVSESTMPKCFWHFFLEPRARPGGDLVWTPEVWQQRRSDSESGTEHESLKEQNNELRDQLNMIVFRENENLDFFKHFWLLVWLDRFEWNEFQTLIQTSPKVQTIP